MWDSIIHSNPLDHVFLKVKEALCSTDFSDLRMAADFWLKKMFNKLIPLSYHVPGSKSSYVQYSFILETYTQ